MYCRITIPKMSDHYKLYVYSAKTADSINTISKIKTLNPLFIIDEAIAKTTTINGKECYILDDSPEIIQPEGITYNGPTQNYVPTSEYETSIGIIKINDYTYVNSLTFNELDTNYIGTVIYYSVIGVDETTNTLTHLSKVNGILMNCKYQEGTRHIYYCDEYLGTQEDVWKKLGVVSWEEILTIGDVNDKISMSKYGLPIVEKVPSIEIDKVNGDTKPVLSRNFMVLEIQNPWQKNNKYFNYRKLKSFKIQNVVGEQYGEFSEPTYQSELPVSIEKMVILRKTDSETPDDIIPLKDQYKDDVFSFEVIRRDGIYYNVHEHKKYGVNKYNIPLGEPMAVFTEGSVQDQIKIQIEALPNHVYSYSIYLIDIYNNVSEPAHFVVRT